MAKVEVYDGEHKCFRDLNGRVLSNSRPIFGITRIDDEPADAIHFVRFVRREKQAPSSLARWFYDLTFTMDGEEVARLENLELEEMARAVGLENFGRIFQAKANKGILRKNSLVGQYGRSPKKYSEKPS